MSKFMIYVCVMMGLCVMPQGYPIDLLQLLPVEEKIQIHKLKNGMTALIQENAFPSETGSFRMVIKKTLCDDVLFSLDTPLNQTDAIDQFFSFCRAHLKKIADSNRSTQMETESPVSNDLESSFSMAPHIAIVAVGDFSSGALMEWIKSYFDYLPINQVAALHRPPIYIGKSSIPKGIALHVDYRISKHQLKTYADLKNSWAQIFAQHLLQQRLERGTRWLEENWVHPYPQFIYPVHGFALAAEEDYSNVLSFLLWEIEQIKAEGFNESEFLSIKERTNYQLEYLAAQFPSPESSAIASFYADMVFSDAQGLSYEPFIKGSQRVITDLRFNEVKPAIQHLLRDAHRSIHIRYPTQDDSHVLTVPDVEEILKKVAGLTDFEQNAYYEEDDILLLNCPISPKPMSRRKGIQPEQISQANNPFAEVQSEATLQDEEDLYLSLPLTEKEKETISFIISTLASKNVFQLGLIYNKMMEKKKVIQHVHPLRFIGCIFGDEDLKRSMKKVKKSSYKWEEFVSNFSKNMKEEHSKNNLFPYVPGFSKEVNANEEKITYYIQKKDWEGLIDYLM
jgi:hypothetical protein